MGILKERRHVQGARWRWLDNTGKLFAMVTGESLSNVFRVSAVLREEVDPERLRRALKKTLPEFEVFQVKLRRGFFWYYFETNTREPAVEKETAYPCRFIDPHSSQLYLFRVSYFKARINLEVFHALTDGMGAMGFLKRLVWHYLEDPGEGKAGAGTASAGKGLKQGERQSRSVARKAENPAGEQGEGADHIETAARRRDSYLQHYKKQEHRGYELRQAFAIPGKRLPLGGESIFHGYVYLDRLKKRCREMEVSITKYLTALLIWSVIQVYLDGETGEEPVAVNLPINLRSFFESETLANFFAVTNISYPARKRPKDFQEVLGQVSRQMDEKIVREKLEETISYNVSTEKKWYVRIAPLAVKHLVTSLIFSRNTKAYTLTLSNLGKVEAEGQMASRVRDFHVIIGVSARQPVKCGAAAFGDTLDVTFASVMSDTRLQDFFYGFLEAEGLLRGRESNGAAEESFDKGNYPQILTQKSRLRKILPFFYGALLAAAVITGIVNAATYGQVRKLWSVIAIAGMAYAALTVRYSVMRSSNLAGKLFLQSLGADVLLVLADWMGGYTGWAFNYAIPSLILFDVIAVAGLMVFNRLNWQSYFMYQLTVTVFSLIPLILWWSGFITRPFMAVFSALSALAVLAVTVFLGDKSVKRELLRRFHI